MTRTPRTGRHTCGPDCRYLRLYEGSQASLNDMASKQSATLGRVAALRNGILSVLKQNFPTQYVAAERQLGHKLGGHQDPDSVLLAFLEGFMRSYTPIARAVRPTAEAVDGVDELRAALAGLGIDVPENTDLRQWASSVNKARGHSSPTVPTETDPDTPNPLPDVPTVTVDDDIPWGEEPPADPPMDVPDPVLDLGSLFGQDDSHPSGEIDPEQLFDSLYDRAPGTSATGEPTPPPTNPPPSVDTAADDPVDTPPTHPKGTDSPSPGQDAATVAAPQEGERQAPAAPSGKKSRPRTAAGTLKPTIFPAAQVPRAPRTKRGAAKTPRVTATPPESPDTAGEAQVATERFDELLDMVTRPGPVFMSDLVKASGSPGLVNAWEQNFQDQGSSAPVRVITPRGHHRARGALVVPHAPELRGRLNAHGKNWWTEALDDGPDRPRLRGARLYETAVLLQRFSDDIVSYHLTSDILTLRINTPAGLTGVVMWLATDAPTGPRRESLTTAVGGMIQDRMTLLAVLTPETGARAVERLAGVISEDAAAHRWAPTMPVVASHSWDFAADGGASALAVL